LPQPEAKAIPALIHATARFGFSWTAL